MTQPESKVKKKIKAGMAKLWPTAWGYMPVQTGYGQHGIFDHIYCVPVTITPEMVGKTVGMFVAIEAKTEKGKLSKYQSMQNIKMILASAVTAVIYGEDEVGPALIDVKTKLTGAKR